MRSLIVVFALMSVSLFAQAKEQTIVLSVPGMTCSVCPITVKKSLAKVEGVISAESEFDTKTATVTFDDTKTNIEALRKATADVGYPSMVKAQ
ncbi:MAG: mercury resistance system periplasmic binding protein MerP [Gammaproteobacteria bacterium]|nr:mercury resistance system periplasmic binding protein MerP [Gammaproteobacteria bacterium]